MNELLSVVIPARDSRPWVGELLESILRQDVAALEVVVVDNQSVDGTAEFVAQVALKDDRVRLIRSDATTAAQARNEGTAAASGAYLVFADSDDIVPDGAYRAMLESLVTSGSDMAIGDHLKFSPTATWSPTARWRAFDRRRTSVVPVDAAELLTGRACWNRMFRRSFWDRVELRFPEIPSVDDIAPMTRAFVNARAVDVVPVPVYLYRDRSDGSSISQQADAVTTIRYLHQEIACAQLVAAWPRLRSQHAVMVLDADGWAHIARFVASDPVPADVMSVRAALSRLLELIPLDALAEVAPVRRVMWALVLLGDWNALTAFASGVVPGSDARARLDAWISALVVIDAADPSPIDVADLMAQGLLPALVNGAEDVPEEWIAEALPALRSLPVAGSEPGLRTAMVGAIETDEPAAVRAVSELRHVVPLVVQTATPTDGGLEIAGALTTTGNVPELTLVLRSDAEVVSVPVRKTAGAWNASLHADDLHQGRWTVSVTAGGITGTFPVVTARMALPPVAEHFLIQPLADRKNGWRFVLDRRVPPKKSIAAALARFRRRSR
ncbi:glycosyltransferase family 2 protein [Curtobacterium sp. MCPF17_052]|uniref:glycosyltransferase family 2 protein n=1 Tax=Curtobacterium sp. MCPF17_052 TaxID=2175655 RepID=UPI000DA859F5|nr:glycosyltransferase family 2 protein [Curtobacterium sp. MCPF17_052]WIB12412.1 glycosyltransferase family 2 protein [Curtobacterium sp. MCPF17_052]